MIQENPDFRTEVFEGEQAQKQLDRTVIPLIGRVFKNLSVSWFTEYPTTDNIVRIGFRYDRTPFPLSYAFSRQDEVSVSFCLCDLERIEVVSNIKKRRDKEIRFVFKQGIVQLGLFHHLFRRREQIWVRNRKFFEANSH